MANTNSIVNVIADVCSGGGDVMPNADKEEGMDKI